MRRADVAVCRTNGRTRPGRGQTEDFYNRVGAGFSPLPLPGAARCRDVRSDLRGECRAPCGARSLRVGDDIALFEGQWRRMQGADCRGRAATGDRSCGMCSIGRPSSAKRRSA